MGLNLRPLRERSGLTACAVAAQIGITQSAYTFWEQGRTFPSADKLPMLADIFGVSIDELYGRSTTIPERGG